MKYVLDVNSDGDALGARKVWQIGNRNPNWQDDPMALE